MFAIYHFFPVIASLTLTRIGQPYPVGHAYPAAALDRSGQHRSSLGNVARRTARFARCRRTRCVFITPTIFLCFIGSGFFIHVAVITHAGVQPPDIPVPQPLRANQATPVAIAPIPNPEVIPAPPPMPAAMPAAERVPTLPALWSESSSSEEEDEGGPAPQIGRAPQAAPARPEDRVLSPAPNPSSRKTECINCPLCLAKFGKEVPVAAAYMPAHMGTYHPSKRKDAAACFVAPMAKFRKDMREKWARTPPGSLPPPPPVLPHALQPPPVEPLPAEAGDAVEDLHARPFFEEAPP